VGEIITKFGFVIGIIFCFGIIFRMGFFFFREGVGDENNFQNVLVMLGGINSERGQ
jgi:hypothetical protein